MERDIFICHAHEDKSEVVSPLVLALEKEDINCWVDEGEIQWGDSITQKINEGLKVSRFVIVVLSVAFLGKNWPKRELNAIMNIEASSGKVKILPLLVGDKNAREKILMEFPLINDKLYLSWEGSPEPVVKAARTRLLESITDKLAPDQPHQYDVPIENIPLPKLRKRFSQRDKDLFMREVFSILKDYFQQALTRLESQYTEVETDFAMIHAQKFIATIYLRGEIKNQCKIWISGMLGSGGIAYSEGRINIDTDNSYNELISVEDDGFDLKLRFMIGMMFQTQQLNLFDPSKAAELLWKRFSASLEQ